MTNYGQLSIIAQLSEVFLKCATGISTTVAPYELVRAPLHHWPASHDKASQQLQ